MNPDMLDILFSHTCDTYAPRALPRPLQAGVDRSKKAKGKHIKGRQAPVCKSCLTTLSHGCCLNRACELFDRGAQ